MKTTAAISTREPRSRHAADAEGRTPAAALRSPAILYLASAITLLAGLAAIFIWEPFGARQWGFDFWEHAAALKQLAINPWHPLHPQFDTHEASRSYTPEFLLLALVGRMFSLSPLGMLALGSIFACALAFTGIWFFSREYFRNEWAPLAVLISLFFFWGKEWVWSSFYNLQSLAVTGGYPSTFVFALAFTVWWFGLILLRRERIRAWHLFAVPILSALLFVSHQLSGMFALGALFAFWAAEPGRGWRRRGILFAASLAGLLISRWWPWFNPWYSATGSQVWNPMWAGLPDFYRPGAVLALCGPALLGLAPLAWFVRKRIYGGLTLGFLAVTGVYIVGGILNNPIAHRFLAFSILYLHLACAWLLLALGGFFAREEAAAAGWRLGREGRRVLFAVCTLIVLGHLSFMTFEVIRVRTGAARRYVDVAGPMRAISGHLAPRSIVLASPEICFALPAFEGRVVTVYRPSPLVEDDSARIRDSSLFFSEAASDDERRAILSRYRVTHILYRKDELQPAVIQGLSRVGSQVAERSPLTLLRAAGIQPR
ncbi:MAG TPA: hypothetical protein VHB50_23175 [Bryobacteraceae bacterium]|nr:hypothetical protein [Bryobacteraceae bacterium]